MKSCSAFGALAMPARAIICLACVGGILGDAFATDNRYRSGDGEPRRTPLHAEASWSWAEILLSVTSALCEVVDCGIVPLRADGSPEETAVRSVIDAYRLEGVIPGLSAAQIVASIDTVDYALAIVDDPRSTLDKGLAVEFQAALVDLRADLLGRLAGSSSEGGKALPFEPAHD